MHSHSSRIISVISTEMYFIYFLQKYFFVVVLLFGWCFLFLPGGGSESILILLAQVADKTNRLKKKNFCFKEKKALTKGLCSEIVHPSVLV